MPTKTTSPKSMAEAAKVYGDRLVPFHISDTIEVTVLRKSRNQILVDVAGLNQGFVPEKEFSFDANELKVGDKILATVLALENDAGLVVLSLRRADRERIWRTLKSHYESGELIKAKVKAANRGGLMIEFGGQEGFLPVSQLSSLHYPKVEGGDTAKILAKLKILVGQTLDVKIITFDSQTKRLIFSEKAIEEDRLSRLASSYKVGDIVDCTVSGIVDFGLFVKIPINDSQVEGLIHVSEISWEPIGDLKESYKLRQQLKAQVVSVDKGKLSLSLKRLEKDPWTKIEDKWKVGTKLTGEITNVTPFGAFVRLANGLDALLHISQIGKEKKLAVGERKNFYILTIDPKTRKINLSLKKNSRK